MNQKLVIVGYLGGDPEMRFTGDGTPVTGFSVAVDRHWTNSDGSKGEETTWFRVSAWRKLAENCNQYLHKGSPVLVEGRVAARAYTDKTGEARASLDMTAEAVRFLPNNKTSSNAGGAFTEYESVPF